MKIRIAAVATFVAISALAPASAGAQTRRDALLDRVKTRCLAQIDRRQRALVELSGRLDARSNLTDEHRSALKAIDDQASSGLTTLANTIQGEDNGQELRAECRQIVDDYRVFVLVRPRARVVVASDRELAAVAKLRDAADRIAAAIDKAKGDGKDTSKAEADLAQLRAASDTAAQHANAVYAEVIHLTPADFTPGVLDRGRADVKAARDAIRTAAQAAHAAVGELKGSSSAT